MGYMCHHAIVVTSWKKEAVEAAHAKAVELFGQFGSIVSNICEATTNGYYSFLIAPDGSKEGWDTSNAGDEAREAMVKWIEHGPCCYEDGTHSFDWCEVQFSDDYDNDYMVRSNSTEYVPEEEDEPIAKESADARDAETTDRQEASETSDDQPE